MPNNIQPRHIKNGEDYSGYNFVTPKIVDDTKDCTTTFTSSDDSTTTDKTSDGMTSVATLSSGETHASLFEKISKMFLNIRKLWNTVGIEDISSIGQTVTGAINNQNTAIAQKLDSSALGKYIYTLEGAGSAYEVQRIYWGSDGKLHLQTKDGIDHQFQQSSQI